MIERIERGPVTVLRMAHGRANAFDLEFLEALERTFRTETSRAVVLTGTGTIFSAGVDLKRLLAEGRGYIERFLPALTGALRALFEMPCPVVAAVNGHAIAGGCVLACACDRRILATGSHRIGAPELVVGVPFPIVPLDLVRHALAPAVAQEVILTGRLYEPDAALAAGVVDELAAPETLLDRAIAAAEALAALPPTAYAMTKRALRRDVVAGWDRLGDGIDDLATEAWSGDEVRNAVQAYVARTLK